MTTEIKERSAAGSQVINIYGNVQTNFEGFGGDYFLDSGFENIGAYQDYFDIPLEDPEQPELIADWNTVILNLAETSNGTDTLKYNDKAVIQKAIKDRTGSNTDSGVDLSIKEFTEVLAVVENVLTDDIFKNVDGYSEKTSSVKIGTVTVNPDGTSKGYKKNKDFLTNILGTFTGKTSKNVFDALTFGKSTRLEKDYVINFLHTTLGAGLGIDKNYIKEVVNDNTKLNESVGRKVFSDIVDEIYTQYREKSYRENPSLKKFLKKFV